MKNLNKKEINISIPFIDNNEINAVKKVINSGWLTSGKETKKFETNIKKYINCKNVLAVNSCTSGLNSAMHALNLKKGDEVITSPMTFVSAINNLYNFGLKIKLVDIDLETYMMDVDKLKKSVSSKTKCIIITHYGGVPFDIDKIVSFCRKKKIKIIEDAATALGSKINGKYIGSNSHSVAVFSLYANKIITTGEGGIMTCEDDKLANRIKIINSCGISKDPWVRKKSKMQYQYDVTYPGFKYNFTDIQSAIGIEQLKKLKKIIKYRELIRNYYLKELKQLIKNKTIFIQNVKKNQKPAFYIFTILLNKKKTSKKRDDLIRFLKEKKVNTSVHYIPANKHIFYKKKFKHFKLSNSNYVYENILSLPFHNNLKMTDIKFVCGVIKKFFIIK
jgi:dTDP-4-amino-4,6-dideoxygalactose transaminase